jgi:hypothetical protein
VPLGQHPYRVPAQPPTGEGDGDGDGTIVILFKIINANKIIPKTIINVESI